MNLVDSSGWVAFFAGSKNASRFAQPLEEIQKLLVPTIIMYEVFKVLLRERGENAAIIAQAHMQQGVVIPLTSEIAVSAASTSVSKHLPMADSIILTTASTRNATLWTQDIHFKGYPGVRFFPA